MLVLKGLLVPMAIAELVHSYPAEFNQEMAYAVSTLFSATHDLRSRCGDHPVAKLFDFINDQFREGKFVQLPAANLPDSDKPYPYKDLQIDIIRVLKLLPARYPEGWNSLSRHMQVYSRCLSVTYSPAT